MHSWESTPSLLCCHHLMPLLPALLQMLQKAGFRRAKNSRSGKGLDVNRLNKIRWWKRRAHMNPNSLLIREPWSHSRSMIQMVLKVLSLLRQDQGNRLNLTLRLECNHLIIGMVETHNLQRSRECHTFLMSLSMITILTITGRYITLVRLVTRRLSKIQIVSESRFRRLPHRCMQAGLMTSFSGGQQSAWLKTSLFRSLGFNSA
jgi:hypothetical protein